MKIIINESNIKEFLSLDDVMNELEKHNYKYYGFRNATEHDLELINSGQTYLEPSHEWVDNKDTEENLNGSCAIYISDEMSFDNIRKRYKKCLNSYFGDTILLIADNNSEWGEGENEIILGSNGYGADVLGFVII